MKRFRKYFAERDGSVEKVTKGKKNKWFDIPPDDLGKNNDITKDIYGIIDKTYSSIGGHVHFKKSTDLPYKYTNWIGADTDDDPDIDVVRFSKKTKAGMKFGGSATDGTAAAKKLMLKKTANLLNTKGYYGEVSDAIAHVLLTRFSVPVVSDPELVKKVMAGKTIEWVGEHPSGKYPGVNGWYKRTIGGEAHIKIMVGKPKG